MKRLPQIPFEGGSIGFFTLLGCVKVDEIMKILLVRVDLWMPRDLKRSDCQEQVH